MKKPKNKVLNILRVTNSAVLIAGYMLGPIYALYVEDLNGSLLDTTFAIGLYAFVGGCTSILIGRYIDKVKEKEYVLIAGYLIVAIGFFGYLFVDSIFMLFVLQAVIGFGEATYTPAFDTLYSVQLDTNNSGKEWGIYESMYYFTYAFAVMTGGVLATAFGFEVLFVVMGMIALISSVYIYSLPRELL